MSLLSPLLSLLLCAPTCSASVPMGDSTHTISKDAMDECGMTPPERRQRSGGVGSSTDRYDEVMLSPVALPPPQAAGAPRGGRGKFERTSDMKKRRSWHQVIHEHMVSFPQLLTTSVCGAECSGCDIFSWANVGVLQQCAQASFGDAVILVDWMGDYEWKEEAKKLQGNHSAVANWFAMVRSMSNLNVTDGTISVAFRINPSSVIVRQADAPLPGPSPTPYGLPEAAPRVPGLVEVVRWVL